MTVPEAAHALDLAPHPEGGWFRRTWTSPTTVLTERGPRPTATAILYLLAPGERSVWHRVVSDELWLWHRGAGLRLTVGGDGDAPVPGEPLRLGPDRPQLLVPGRRWQSARPDTPDDEVLVTCVVSPGFDDTDFELA